MKRALASRWTVAVLLVAVGWLPIVLSAFGQRAPKQQSDADVQRKSAGCLTCHQPDAPSMHRKGERIGCTDCHGGNAAAIRPPGTPQPSTGFDDVKRRAH